MILAISFLVVWIWAALEPLYFDDWLLENILVFISLPIIFFTYKYFEFSILSYLLITLFLILHVIGSHYTYAEVPWGITLGEWLGTDRNMYDRLVHLLFGLLLVYPIREIFIRTTNISSGFWAYFVPFMVISAFSGIYEVIEWGAAVIVNPEAGIAFLGSQGDIWDAQKDMFLAKIGALITLGSIIINHRN
jgi:putative membrane protein